MTGLKFGTLYIVTHIFKNQWKNYGSLLQLSQTETLDQASKKSKK